MPRLRFASLPLHGLYSVGLTIEVLCSPAPRGPQLEADDNRPIPLPGRAVSHAWTTQSFTCILTEITTLTDFSVEMRGIYDFNVNYMHFASLSSRAPITPEVTVCSSPCSRHGLEE
ncbi:hypothetical protein FB451DRAFT_1371348 [Mycena latifolia]|nr:hypothetical protein FB451DRAFT_1371348 [Mycena latifolia]